VEGSELASGLALMAILLGLAGYYGWQQLRTFRRVRQTTNLSDDDRRYVRRQAWRRSTASVLMVVAAAQLAGSFLLNKGVREIAGVNAAAEADQKEPELSPQQKAFQKWYTIYWIVFLLIVLAIIVLAYLDLMAIRRFSLRHMRQIQADRRAMIEQEVALLRQRRNGHL
jgi:hypothetical protein